MFAIKYSVLCSFGLRNQKLLLAFQRLFMCSSCILEKEVKCTKIFKQKATVIKRRFPASGENSPVVLEWKRASSVIKRLNWENKYLFGPVQSGERNSYNDNKIQASNEIIQHKTQIPVIEPNADIGLSRESLHNRPSAPDMNILLKFPLMNKSDPEVKSTILEMNYLRKYLESMSNKSSAPTVTLILEKTMPKNRVEILQRWRRSMIAQLGQEGFEKYYARILSSGSSLHKCINSYLTSTPEAELQIEEANLGHWKSMKAILPEIREVKLLEEQVFHPFLQYKGVVDCFARYKDHLVVIDWKTSKKVKSTINNTYDNPLQIAAYVGALNFDPKFQYLANKGLIVIAYENGMKAGRFFIDENAMQQYWKEWLKRVKLYWESITIDPE
ncbi:mitochondrial genome maintenance exonuclease 1-like [Stegodyphus dumicola]|uniref:mitochondrial genome maintenance exonuclease 1-like n=1 Tax=Stegodyphus dumicola TaxID=202533 RepID=UPI0015AE2669|nr:mitochondrial genome maintenance exonuclease 1-like [Stegodyphus dumicola]